MKCRWICLEIWLVQQAIIQCSQDCSEPSGICFPSITQKGCLQNSFNYNGDVMLAQGSVSDLDNATQEARKRSIEGLLQLFILPKIFNENTGKCELWNATKSNNHQSLGVLTDTGCRYLLDRPLPEGPSVESLKLSQKLFCLPWSNSKDRKISFANKGHSYCRNPTNSSKGPYCYISVNHTRPCFRSCEPLKSFAGVFKVGVEAAEENETSCNSVCNSHQLNCSFEGYDRLLEGTLMENLAKDLPPPKSSCVGQKGGSIFGNELAVSRWNFPVYKISTGCVYGYKYRTDVPKCEGTIENSTDFVRLCACTGDKTTTQTSGFTKRLPAMFEPTTIVKNAPPEKSKSDDSKNFKIAIAVTAVLFFIVITLIAVSILLLIRRKSKSRKKLGAIASVKTYSSKQRSKPSSSSRKSQLKKQTKSVKSMKSIGKKQISMKSHEISKPTEISTKSKQPKSLKTKSVNPKSLKTNATSKLEEKSTGKSNVYFTKDELNVCTKVKFSRARPNASLETKSAESKEMSINKSVTKVPTEPPYEFVLTRAAWAKVKAEQILSKKEVSEMKDSKKA